MHVCKSASGLEIEALPLWPQLPCYRSIYLTFFKKQVYNYLNGMIAAKAVNPFYYFTLSEPPQKRFHSDRYDPCVCRRYCSRYM